MIELYSMLFFDDKAAPILPTASSGGQGSQRITASSNFKLYRDLESDPHSVVIEYVPTGLKHKAPWSMVKTARVLEPPKEAAPAAAKKGKG